MAKGADCYFYNLADLRMRKRRHRPREPRGGRAQDWEDRHLLLARQQARPGRREGDQGEGGLGRAIRSSKILSDFFAPGVSIIIFCV